MRRFSIFAVALLSASSYCLFGQEDCQLMTYVEWPESDYTASLNGDSALFDRSTDRLYLRGLPKRKQQTGIIEYSLAVDRIRSARLVLYPTTATHSEVLSVYRLSKHPDSKGQFMVSTSNAHFLGQTTVGQEAPISIDLNPGEAQHDHLILSLRSDSKKLLECTSLESGLGSQLLLRTCATGPGWNQFTSPTLGPSMQLQRVPEANRINMLLSAMPKAGTAQLIFFNGENDIVRTIPIQVGGMQVELMQLDLGTLQHDQYRVVLRMGAVVVDDQLPKG